MYILVRLSFGDILVYTPSVFYNCDTIWLFVCVHAVSFVVEHIHVSTLSVGYNCYTSGCRICILCVFFGVE